MNTSLRVLGLCCAGWLLLTSARAADLTPAQIAEAATPSVVLIKVPNGLGSGFVVSTDGRVATNLHVIRGAREATIVSADGKEFKNVELLAMDAAHDIVVLRIVGAQTLKPLTLGDSATARPGQHVVAIGHPLGLGNTVSDGLVSAIREFPGNESLLQISAPISPGSSGGPVLDDRGLVIGISTLVVSGGQNLNFAVPANVIKPLLLSNKGYPLALAAGPAPRERHIPKHAAGWLDSCAAPQFVAVVNEIDQAIKIGAPLYNQGNIEACYRIYAAAAIAVQKKVEACPGPKQALLDGLDTADKLKSWDDKAWAMRDAFDGILAATGNAAAAASAGAASTSVARNVPNHPDSIFKGCEAKSIEAIGRGIVDAINNGAPLYNSGNVEACYRIYEGAISEIDRKVQDCAAAKQALHIGLSTAETRDGWSPKAWALRDAFDGIENAIARRGKSP